MHRQDILVLCECSGNVRDAFNARGHNAISCDLLPSDKPGPHIIGDGIPLLKYKWDIIIAFPVCTYLCSSGLHWNNKVPGRAMCTDYAIEFVKKIIDAPCKKVVIENSIGCISTRIRKPDQIIQPNQFGHPESKATCLWVRGLPLLVPTNILTLPDCGYWDNQTPSGQNKLAPSTNRAKLRGTTYPGIADAMADQWGNEISLLAETL